MRKLLLVAIVALLAPASLWCDTIVSYTTSGTFGTASGCSAGGTSTTCGGMTVAFQGQLPGTYVTVPSDEPYFSTASLGKFLVSGSSSGTFNVPFTLTITQSSPEANPNSGVLTSLVSGKLFFSASQASIKFADPLYISLGGITYDITPWLNSSFALALNPPSTAIVPGSPAETTLSANVSVPEPGTLMLLGSGMIGIAGLVRRRLLAVV